MQKPEFKPDRRALVLGIESSCDETGIALYSEAEGLLGQAVHTQIAMHADYGGVVPELASRDHIQRVLPLIRQVLREGGKTLSDLDAVAYTSGPGLAGALLVGASIANALAFSLRVSAIGIHHLEGHLLSPLLSKNPPPFPFLALLVSGGHTQLMEVQGVGDYRLLGETLDDAAGEAFDKTAQLLGLGYPGGPAVARLAELGRSGIFKLPRPMLHSGDLDFSFSGLKTAVLTLVRNHSMDDQAKADIALAFEDAVVDVLTAKCKAALLRTGLKRLVIAGGVGANRSLRAALQRVIEPKGDVYFPELALCTDNGAMIALAGALRLRAEQQADGYAFSVRPRWELEELKAVSGMPD